MPDIKPYILSVDDEEMNQHVVAELLSEDFEVGLAYNGQECLDMVAERIPDLILLDVNMPILNGLETCQQLRKKFESRDILVIFVSALVSPRERLAGYEAGGDDYVTKPFDEDELIHKIKLYIKQQQEHKKQQAELKAQQEVKELATRSAMSAILSSSEMGVVIQFMQAIITRSTVEELVKEARDAFLGYEINGCIMLYHQDEPQFFFTDDYDRPIEKDVLKEAHTKGKVISFSGRAIFNSEHASMLIRKMPADEDKRKRFVDHLSIMIDAIEEKLMHFIMLSNEKSHFKALEKTIHSVAVRLGEVKESNYEQRSQNAKILGELLQQTEELFLRINLDEIQEQEVISLLEQAETKSNKVFEQGKAAELTFDDIVQDLKQLAQPPNN